MRRTITAFDIALLKLGRHFEDGGIVLGKDKRENEKLVMLAKKFGKGALIIPCQPGPTAYIRRKAFEAKAKELIRKHSKHSITSFQTVHSI